MYEYSANIGSVMRMGMQFYEDGGIRIVETMSIEEMEKNNRDVKNEPM